MLLRWRQQFPATFFDSGRKQDLFRAPGGGNLSVPFFSLYSYPKARSGISGFLAAISDVSSCRTLWRHQCHRYPNRSQCFRPYLLLIRSLNFFFDPFQSGTFFSCSFFASFIIYLLPRWNLIVRVKGVQAWEGLLVVSDFSTSWAEAIFRVKCSDTLISTVIGSWNSNVIGSKDGSCSWPKIEVRNIFISFDALGGKSFSGSTASCCPSSSTCQESTVQRRMCYSVADF